MLTDDLRQKLLTLNLVGFKKLPAADAKTVDAGVLDNAAKGSLAKSGLNKTGLTKGSNPPPAAIA